MNIQDLSGTFSALGDPNRLSIIERLMEEGELTAGEIASNAAISAPSVSRHLKVLTDAGLVLRRPEAQRRLYRANPNAIRKIVAWTGSHRAFWTAGLDRLVAAVERDDG